MYETLRIDGDPNEVGHVIHTGASGASREISYETVRVVGHGSFGVVYQARCRENDEEVAIKKVLQDKRFKNRELQIMKAVDHTNVVKLIHSFYHTTEEDEVYLNLVLEFVPDTVYRIGKHYHKNNQRMPGLLVKVVHVSNGARVGERAQAGDLSPRHQAAKFTRGYEDARVENLRLW